MPNRLLSFAWLAHQVATDTLPDRAHRFAPKRYTQPQLLACLLVKEYLGLDYRTTQETLEVSDGLREALHLRRVPDYTTLWRFAHDKATADVVAHALGETVRLCKTPGHDPPQRALTAIDSTGMRCGHAWRYFEKRRRRNGPSAHRARGYQKWAAALWTGPQLVTAQLSKPGRLSGSTAAGRALGGLRGGRAGSGRRGLRLGAQPRLLALGVEALIPAKTRRYVAGPRGGYRAEMVAALGCATLGVEAAPCKTYGQRWLVETLMSVVKRKSA